MPAFDERGLANNEILERKFAVYDALNARMQMATAVNVMAASSLTASNSHQHPASGALALQRQFTFPRCAPKKSED
jgi:hypothetical protein